MTLNTDLLDEVLTQQNFTDVLKARDHVGPVSYNSHQYINKISLRTHLSQHNRAQECSQENQTLARRCNS